MSYDVRTERNDPRALAAVRATTTWQRLGADIVRLLDMVWPVLREQGVSTGQNVVVYYGGGRGTLDIEAGVDDTSIDDLWSALTDPRRLARWIGEVEGELRLGVVGGQRSQRWTTTAQSGRPRKEPA